MAEAVPGDIELHCAFKGLPNPFTVPNDQGSPGFLSLRASVIFASSDRPSFYIQQIQRLRTSIDASIDNVIATIDVERFTSDEPCGIVGQERSGNTHIVNADKTSGGSLRFCLVEQGIELRDS